MEGKSGQGQSPISIILGLKVVMYLTIEIDGGGVCSVEHVNVQRRM